MSSQLINFFIMYNDFTFNDVLDQKKYLIIQNRFKYYDERTGQVEEYFNEPVLEDFTIVYGGLDPITGENELTEESFFINYLFPRISQLAKEYSHRYNKKMDELMISNGNDNLYYKKAIDYLFFCYEQFNNAKHLTDDVLALIIKQLDICVDEIQTLNVENESLRGEKLSFKSNRQDVLVLFFILREKGIIKWHSNPELKVLIENNFKSYDSKTKTYLDINIGRNIFSDFKNGSRPINQSIERLKNIFQEENFFNIT